MQRPISVTVFGILNFVFAAFGVIGLIAAINLLGLPPDSKNPVIHLIHECPGYATWLKISIALDVLGCGLLLAAGVGLLGLKPWARTLAIAYAIYAIAFCLGAMLINLALMDQPMIGPAQQQRAFETVAAVGGPISGTIGGFFWVLYPLLLLGFLLRPKMTAVFRPPAPPQS